MPKARTIERRRARRRKRRTPRTKPDGRGSKKRIHGVNNNNVQTTSITTGATPTGNSNLTPNINRIMPLPVVSSFIAKNTACKNCGGKIVYKSDSKVSQIISQANRWKTKKEH